MKTANGEKTRTPSEKPNLIVKDQRLEAEN